MKIEVSRDEFARAFALAAMVAPPRSPKEILQNVKLVAGDGVNLSATDLEVGISVDVIGQVSVLSPGEVLLPAAKTMGMLRESTDDVLSIDADDSAVLIAGKRSKCRFVSGNPSEFPVLSQESIGTSHSIGARSLSAAISRTLYAVDPTNSRFALGGIRIEGSGNELKFIATDGRRLSVHGSGISIVGAGADAILPHRAATVVQRVVGADGVVELSIGDNSILFKTEHAIVSARPLEGRFPEWQDVIPSPDDYHSVDIPVNEFRTALGQAAIMADKDSKLVQLTFEDGCLKLESSTAEIGSADVTVPISWDSETISVMLNHQYLTDVLKPLDQAASVTVSVRNSRHSIKLETEDGFAGVIMPMATKS